MKHGLAVLFAAAATATAAPAHAAPERSGLAALTAEELKSAYLECDRLAAATFLNAGGAANCSVVHEELKQRVFDGDFQRLLDWWQVQRTAPRTAQGEIVPTRE